MCINHGFTVISFDWHFHRTSLKYFPYSIELFYCNFESMGVTTIASTFSRYPKYQLGLILIRILMILTAITFNSLPRFDICLGRDYGILISLWISITSRIILTSFSLFVLYRMRKLKKSQTRNMNDWWIVIAFTRSPNAPPGLINILILNQLPPLCRIRFPRISSIRHDTWCQKANHNLWMRSKVIICSNVTKSTAIPAMTINTNQIWS